MPRRKRNDETPGLSEMIRAMGYGWALDLVQVLAFVAFVVGTYFLVTHIAFYGLKSAFDHVGK